MLLAAIIPRPGSAAEEGSPPRTAITPELSLVAAKRLEGAREFLTLEQWPDGLDALQRLSQDFGDALVEVEPRRFLNVRDVCLATIALLPPEGLAVYRARVDGAASFLFEEALRSDQPAAMRQLLEKFYPSSFGDDALLWLGDDAWEQGDLNRARLYWTQLVPLTGPAAAPRPLVLRYPDADIPRPLVLARLVLCSTMQRDSAAAWDELLAFRELYPAATGRLAGREGVLHEILEEVLSDAAQSTEPPSLSGCPTFAGRPDRNGAAPALSAPLQPRWQTGLADSELPLVNGLRPPLLTRDFAETFPVVRNGIVLVQDDSGIRALTLSDGSPAWPGGRPNDRGLIYQATDAGSVQFPSLGIPRYSGMISGGRCYARVGPPVIAPAANSLRRLGDRLVALDVQSGEGRLEWEVTAEELLSEQGWRFTGAPLAVGDRLYVPMRRAAVQIEISTACIDAATGRLIWRQPVAIDLEPPPESWHRVDHELLTHAAGTIYFSTEAGLVAALDDDSGKLNWVSTYPSYQLSHTEISHPAVAGLLPPVFDRGTLYLAPRDAAHVMAIDAATGVLRWRIPRPGRVNALLGVVANVLVAGGDRLWRIEPDSGRLLEPFGYDDPAGFGCGRGAIAGSSVFWTTHDELFEVDVASGRALRRIPLELLGLATGGNVVIADGHLLIAEPDRLTVFAAE